MLYTFDTVNEIQKNDLSVKTIIRDYSMSNLIKIMMVGCVLRLIDSEVI